MSVKKVDLATEGHLRSIFETIVDGIIMIDDKGLIWKLNPSAEKMFGYFADEVRGKNVKMLMPRSYRLKHDGYLFNYIKTGVAKIIGIGREVVGQRKDGSQFPADLAISEMWVDEQRYFTGIVRDISERKKAENEVKAAKTKLQRKMTELAKVNKELAKKDQLKSIFLASMSHELRTPLNSIIGFTGIMLQGLAGKLSEEQQKQMRIVFNSANHLLSLINEVLDVSKIEAGQMLLSYSEFQLEEIMEEVATTISPLANEKNLQILVNTTKGITLTSDRMRLKQILMNLMSNAVKFTLKGSVEIAAEVVNGDCLKVRVVDTGVGMDEDSFERLFMPFMQLGNSLIKQHEGTGLGLYITKKLVNLMGGEISARSKPAKGSEFAFSIPIRFKHARGTKILIIEDTEENFYLMKIILEKNGFEVIWAKTGAMGVNMAKKLKPDLIITDIQLPDINGMEVIKKIRAFDRISVTPIIAVTSYAMAGDQRRILDAGCQGYIEKPINPDTFSSEIKVFLNTYSHQPKK
ncbi:MAG: PAS domain S-box protein [Nitrospinaceae bacterium]|nr:PAS domain S-box protein [Nitrospinaceae bacterium]